MELSWSTFVLEIINFLVLVWILKRFLYRPVLDIVDKRRQSINDELQQARQQRDEADRLKGEYENRLADWEQERQQLRDKLAEELDEERSRQLTALQEQLRSEQEKAAVSEQQRRAETSRQTELQALQQASGFAARLLQEASGPELETRLVELVLRDLDALPGDQLESLQTQWGDPPAKIDITSAFTLPAQQRQGLETALQRVTGLTPQFSYNKDDSLLAGLQISIGAWVLNMNLRDELKGFAEFAHVTH
ncbi:MAG: F0F1 ATP synthase subunit delta [Gammaproteobacteria bacterium]|nr:F0F1 ATP synthase subunit delta [Pseudomonadales bacterium]